MSPQLLVIACIASHTMLAHTTIIGRLATYFPVEVAYSKHFLLLLWNIIVCHTVL